MSYITSILNIYSYDGEHINKTGLMGYLKHALIELHAKCTQYSRGMK